MTVSSENKRNAYVATGGQTIFAYEFRILDETHISVYQNGTLLTTTTHYTVSNVGTASGGNITLVSGATASDTITIIRNVPLTQEVDYVENDAFPAQTHENALDQLTMAVQEMGERLDRTVLLDVESTSANLSLEDPTAGYFLQWKSDLSGLISTDTIGLTGGATFNDGGAAVDFRVESDNSTHAFFIDGTNDRVGISNSNLAPTDGLLHIQASDTGGIPLSSANELVLEGDTLSGMTILSTLQGVIAFGDAATSGQGQILYVHSTDTLSLRSASAESLAMNSTESVFNNAGLDRDFRVESDLNTHMLFVDAGNNSVHIDNSLLAGAGDGDLVMASNKDLRWINNAGTSSANQGITFNASDELEMTMVTGPAAIGTFTPSHKFIVNINGTRYYIQLDAV